MSERGGKPGFYVVVSRAFVAGNTDVSTVICAPIYSEILGLETEVVLGPDDGLPRVSAVRCDFLTLMFKRRLTDFNRHAHTREARGARPSLSTRSRFASRTRRPPSIA